MLSQCLLIFPIKLFFFFFSCTEAVLYITIMHCIFFGRLYCVWDAWSTLDCKWVFFGAVVNWIEDKRHTPLVAALSFRRSLRGRPNDSQRRPSLPFSFRSPLFSFFFLYLAQSFSLIIFLLFIYTVQLFLSPHHPACLRHRSISPSLSLLLEDTRCKQSPSQRRTPHTISLAFKGVEYGQLCWRLNSLKPPFLLQRFIVGESVSLVSSLGCPEVDARGRLLFPVLPQCPPHTASLQPSLTLLTPILWQKRKCSECCQTLKNKSK